MKHWVIAILAAIAYSATAEIIELRTKNASCRIDLNGARMLSFRVGGDELLWNDNPPQTRASDWAHGGIPVCWPRFGVDESGAIHGGAWRREFAVKSRNDDSARSEVLLFLEEGPARLDYSIVLTDALTLEITTVNFGTNDFACSFGLHPYLRVAEREKSTVEGIDGLSFEDDPSRPKPERGVWHGSLRLTDSIDRIFRLQGAGAFALHDPLRRLILTVECEGASHLNIWNPGPEKLCPGVVPGDEWRRFVCVEPIFVGGADGAPVPIPPGGRRSLKATMRAHAAKRACDK